LARGFTPSPAKTSPKSTSRKPKSGSSAWSELSDETRLPPSRSFERGLRIEPLDAVEKQRK
jgi:hypothetical protein